MTTVRKPPNGVVGAKHGRRYDWAKIFSSKISTLRRDKDYNGFEHTFSITVHRAAKHYGYKVKVKIGDRNVIVSVVGRCRRVDKW